MYIEQLATHHDRKSFTCGEPEVNDFLRSPATLNNIHGLTWVVVPEQGSNQIIAFYTIDPDPITGITYDDEQIEPVGLIVLQMLGVATTHTRQGIGTRLLWRIVKQILITASYRSINALLLTALNDDSKNWYLSRPMGFCEIAPGSMHLLLPVATMRMLPNIETLRLPHAGF